MWPVRVQQRRLAGWRKPPGAVSVARPHRFHNPHRVDESVGVTRAEAVRRFREDLVAGRLGYGVDEVRAELAGRDLMCFCPLFDDGGGVVPCHAQVLLEVANARRVETRGGSSARVSS